MCVKIKEKRKMEKEQREYVESVVKSYQEKEFTKLDELKRLDSKVKLPAEIFAYVFGIVGALVLGLGMCIAMGVILAELFILGIVIGLVGIVMVTVNYFIYQKILKSRKEKYAEEVLSLSKELLNK